MQPYSRMVLDLVEVAERAAWCARSIIRIHAVQQTTRKDFCDALYHLDQLHADRLNIHRLELERILLAAAVDCEEGPIAAAGATPPE